MRRFRFWGLTLVVGWTHYMVSVRSYILFPPIFNITINELSYSFKLLSTEGHWICCMISNNTLEVAKSWSNDISFSKLWLYTMSGNSVHIVWNNPMYGKKPSVSPVRPKTSSLYVVCWNAKCFPSSDASSIPRFLTPARAAFLAFPGSTGITWVKDKRRGESDQWTTSELLIGHACLEIQGLWCNKLHSVTFLCQ